jgi:hypothetical protein
MEHVSSRNLLKPARATKGLIGTALAWYVLALSVVAYASHERAARLDRDCALVASRDVFRLPAAAEPTDVESICPHRQ